MNVIYLGYLVQFARLLKRSEVVTELAIGYESDLQRGREFKEVSSTFDELFFDATSINENPEVKKKFLKADLIVVAAFSQIISQELIDCANGKIINFHPSLLPSYRGGQSNRVANFERRQKGWCYISLSRHKGRFRSNYCTKIF